MELLLGFTEVTDWHIVLINKCQPLLFISEMSEIKYKNREEIEIQTQKYSFEHSY